MDWHLFSNVMDLGCGPAEFTYNYLLPLISEHGQITGIDLSVEMINHARCHYGCRSLQFDIVDVQSRKQTCKYNDVFDVIFSSCCLHWVPNQRATMENVFDMLKHGGNFIAAFVACTPVNEIFEIMTSTEKWKSYLSNMNNLIFPYQNYSKPENVLRKLLEDVGFTVMECVVLEVLDKFADVDTFFESINATCQITQYLPEDLIDSYKLDFLSIAKANNFYTTENDGQVILKNKLFNFHAEKPPAPHVC